MISKLVEESHQNPAGIVSSVVADTRRSEPPSDLLRLDFPPAHPLGGKGTSLKS